MSAYILTLTSFTFITNLVQAQSYTLQTTPTEDTWQASSITPTQSTDYGTIRIGQQMSMEFDFIFHGRSNTPRPNYPENFFRIGHSAALVKGCDGEDSRYPSMWLTYNGYGDILDISTSSGTSCTPIYKLTNYNDINPESTHHMEITINNSFVSIDIRGGGKPNYNQYFSRNPTQEKYLNDSVPVWFMSNKFDDTDYNIGSATFSDIIIRSSVFTTTPVLIPTGPPTVKPTTPTGPPTLKPTTPTGPPTLKPTTPTGPPTVKPTISPIFYILPTGPTTTKESVSIYIIVTVLGIILIIVGLVILICVLYYKKQYKQKRKIEKSKHVVQLPLVSFPQNKHNNIKIVTNTTESATNETIQCSQKLKQNAPLDFSDEDIEDSNIEILYDVGPSTEGVINEMNDDEVRKWLREIVTLPRYYEMFVNNGLTSLNLISKLETFQELQYIGIQKKGHQIVIMKCINSLQADDAQSEDETHFL